MPDAESRSFVYTAGSTYLGNSSDGGIPNITGSARISVISTSSGDFQQLPTSNHSGCRSYIDTVSSRQYFTAAGSVSKTFTMGISINARDSNSIYKNDITYVRPKCIIVHALIKFSI